MKKNSILKKLGLLACACLTAVGITAAPKMVKAAEQYIEFEVAVRTDNTWNIDVGAGNEVTIVQDSGKSYTLKSEHSPVGNLYEIYRLKYDESTPLGTKFTISQIKMPQGYELNFCKLPMTKVLDKDIYDRLEEAKKNGYWQSERIRFDVYVRQKGTKASLNNVGIDSCYLEYTGKPQDYKGKLEYHDTELIKGKDYTMECSNNIMPGQATVVFTGMGEFAGSKRTYTYTISSKYLDSNDKNVSISIPEQTYTGSELKPPVTVKVYGKTLKEGKDYTVTYSENVMCGTGRAEITLNGGYRGWFTREFKINFPKTQVPKKNTTVYFDNCKYKITKSAEKDGTVMFLGPISKKHTTFEVPDSIIFNGYEFKVTSIYTNAFKDNKSLTSLTIGKNVETIGSYAFYGDSKLKTIEFKGLNVKSVGKDVFKGIYSKATIKVPSKRLKTYTKLFSGKGQSKYVKIVK